MTEQSNFQVDLRGVVDLLSHHLYSSPRVYVRELLQNAVDAITSRSLADPDAPRRVTLHTGQDTLVVSDTGVGLDPGQVRQLLATIGRTSKRDEIGFAREEFLGQFGIGLLSAFLVADEVRVVTRPADGPTSEWVGRADGTYTVAQVADRDQIGTTVTVAARPGEESWFEAQKVRDLALHYGRYLPLDISLDGMRLTATDVPWGGSPASPTREARLLEACQETFGFTPFDTIPLDIPLAGLQGVAFVLPFPGQSTERPAHRVYLKRMLLSERADTLLPAWAFFVRCLVDTTALRPTASRESLFEDDVLDATREAVAAEVRRWVVDLGTRDPGRLRKFLSIHQLGVLAMALEDDDTLRLVDEWVTFGTNAGPLTPREIRARADEILYVLSSDEFRQVAAPAAAQGILVVNAGHVHEADIIERLPDVVDTARVRRFDATELAGLLAPLSAEDEDRLRSFTELAAQTLADRGVEVAVREFEPAELPVMYLIDRSAVQAEELESSRRRADELWSGILTALNTSEVLPPQLVFNARNPIVQRVASAADDALVRTAVLGLYGQALLLGYHPMSREELSDYSTSYLRLLDRALDGR